MSDLRKYGESATNAVLGRVGCSVSQIQERKPLAHDLLESEGAYLVVLDAPGAHAKDVQIRFFSDEIEIRIGHFHDFHEGCEMRFLDRGLTLSETVAIPSGTSVEAVEGTATVGKHDTLQIRIPKGEHAGNIAVTEEEDETDGEANTESDDEASFDGVNDQDA